MTGFEALSAADVANLASPCCRAAMERVGDALVCQTCVRAWPVQDNLPRLFEPGAVRGNDRLMRLIYDNFAPLHDPAVSVLLPLMGSGTERVMRHRYFERLALSSLRAPPDGGPVRILEVGMGTGANVPRIYDALPSGLDVELWGVDLAQMMLRGCVRRVKKAHRKQPRLVLADAHALPFRDGFFDRVFHIGATNNYRDPDLALAEMARVAKPGTPIVVVDERLAPDERHTLYHRAMYRLVTFYDFAQRDPKTMVPRDAVDVRDEQIARFFYCLTFAMPRTESPKGETSRATSGP
ncbi:MAG: methyltransferase domain-containing protein [Deltaproteobacteria bacterium]